MTQIFPYLRRHSTPATLKWLESNYKPAEGICILRNALYKDYIQFCGQNAMQPVNAASFGKIIRQKYPSLTTRRLGTRGHSKYHYYGLTTRRNFNHFHLQDYSNQTQDYKSRTIETSNGVTQTDKAHHAEIKSATGTIVQCNMNSTIMQLTRPAEQTLIDNTINSGSMLSNTDFFHNAIENQSESFDVPELNMREVNNGYTFPIKISTNTGDSITPVKQVITKEQPIVSQIPFYGLIDPEQTINLDNQLVFYTSTDSSVYI